MRRVVAVGLADRLAPRCVRPRRVGRPRRHQPSDRPAARRCAEGGRAEIERVAAVREGGTRVPPRGARHRGRDSLSDRTPREQAQKAARRFATYVVGGILTLFLLSWGPRMGQGAFAQISDEERRTRARRHRHRRAPQRTHVPAARARGRRSSIGLVSWIVCRVADVPAPAPLGLIIGITSMMPYLGIVLGSIPAFLLAAGFRSFTVGRSAARGRSSRCRPLRSLLQRRHARAGHLRRTRAHRGSCSCSATTSTASVARCSARRSLSSCMALADAIGTDDPEAESMPWQWPKRQRRDRT